MYPTKAKLSFTLGSLYPSPRWSSSSFSSPASGRSLRMGQGGRVDHHLDKLV